MTEGQEEHGTFMPRATSVLGAERTHKLAVKQSLATLACKGMVQQSTEGDATVTLGVIDAYAGTGLMGHLFEKVMGHYSPDL